MKNLFNEFSDKTTVVVSDVTENVESATSPILTSMKGLGEKATSAAKQAGASLSKGVEATGSMIVDASSFLTTNAAGILEAGEHSAKRVGQASHVVVNAAGNAISKTANFASQSLSTIATAALDQNGDGELNQEDLKLATEKCVALAKEAAKEIASSSLAKEIVTSSLVKDTASLAAVGAFIAIPVPLIGPMAGAAIGATLGAYKHFTKK